MSMRLHGSVGQGGRNLRSDVSLVQSLLIGHGQQPGGALTVSAGLARSVRSGRSRLDSCRNQTVSSMLMA
jgi:hypothetical protein